MAKCIKSVWYNNYKYLIAFSVLYGHDVLASTNKHRRICIYNIIYTVFTTNTTCKNNSFLYHFAYSILIVIIRNQHISYASGHTYSQLPLPFSISYVSDATWISLLKREGPVFFEFLPTTICFLYFASLFHNVFSPIVLFPSFDKDDSFYTDQLWKCVLFLTFW